MRNHLTTQVMLGTTGEPAWSQRVDRWHQLDEISFCFCEALHRWDLLKDYPQPDIIFVASPGASNLADQDFAASDGGSPAKFVFTLPNICASVILQILQKTAKVYCIQQGENTYERALQEARAFAQAGKNVWVMTSPPVLEKNARTVRFDFIQALSAPI